MSEDAVLTINIFSNDIFESNEDIINSNNNSISHRVKNNCNK